MKKRAVCLTATLAFSWFAARAAAQSDVEFHSSFGCSSTQTESTFSADLNHPSKLRVPPVTDQKEMDSARTGGFHTIYTKIDSSKYKVSRIDFYIRHERPKDLEHSASYAPLTIYLKLTAPNETSWWKVTDNPDKQPFEESILSADFPQDETQAQPPVAIVPATGDRTIPIFSIQWGRLEQGQPTNNVEAHLLLDLRSAQPMIAADLSCNSITAFGACQVWDTHIQDRNNYECEWVAADKDFRCEATTWNENAAKRVSKAWFQLLSGKEMPFEVPAGNPTTLQQFAELAERDASWRTRQAELPGLGETSDIIRLPAAHDRIVHILAAYGDEEAFSAQFFYVILSKDAPELGYVPSISLFADDPEDKARNRELDLGKKVAEQQKLPMATNRIETGTSLSFDVKELITKPLTHIYQITAREDTSRAIYWLAIDDQQADGTTLISMTKLASNIASYFGCGRYRTEDSAATITNLKGRNFRAEIDVEPAHTSSDASEGFIPPATENGEKLEDQCPYSVQVEWNHSEWKTGETKTHCGPTFSPRQVTIADDGTLTAKPAAVDTPDSR